MPLRLSDLLPKHHSELLLSFDEYVDTWGQLIEVGYGSIMTDEEVFPSLGLDGDGSVRLSVEATLALCFDAMRTWRRGRRVSDAFAGRLEDAMVQDAARRLMGDDAAGQLLDLYRAHVAVFTQLMPSIGKEDAEGEKRELVGVARYVASRCSGREEEQNLRGIELVSLHLVQAHELFRRLDANSIPDGNTMLMKKPRFIVREEL